MTYYCHNISCIVKRFTGIIFFLLLKAGGFAQSHEIDSLRHIVETTRNDSVKVESGLKLAFRYVFSDSANAVKYINQSLQLSLDKNIPSGEATAYLTRGVFYDVRGGRDSAYYYFDKGLQFARKHKLYGIEVRALNNLGMNSRNAGKLLEAQSFFFEALNVNHKIDSTERISDISMLSNIGLVYQDQGVYEKALEYHHKALELRKKEKNKEPELPISYNNLGICYRRLNRFDEAVTVLQQGIAIARKYENVNELVKAYNSLANIYTIRGKHKDALALHLKRLELASAGILSPKDIAVSHSEAANCCILLKDYSNAAVHLEKAFQIVAENPELEAQVHGLYTYRANLYYILGQPEKGLEYQLKAQNISENQYSKEFAQQLSEMEVKYETAQKEQTITKQALAILQKDKALAQRNVWIIAIVSLFAVSFITYYFITNRNRAKAQKEEEEKTNRAIFESEQKERIRIARDLHDSIGQKLSVMKMLMPQANGDENITKIRIFLDETTTEVRSISHNLIPEILNFGLVKAIDEMADRINSTENIHVEFKADEELEKLSLPKQTELSLYRIVQEILSNIVRHAQTDKILIELKAVQNFIQINIQDNGVGFDTNVIDQSEGLGWKNIFARIKLINGDLKIQSEKNKGSNFFINIPVA